jgi:hypothetical protein
MKTSKKNGRQPQIKEEMDDLKKKRRKKGRLTQKKRKTMEG